MTTAQVPQPALPVMAPGPFTWADRAAIGPNYGIGGPYHPSWTFNDLQDAKVVTVPSNFGQEGGFVEYDWQRLHPIGDPDRPALLKHKPLWNVLIPTINWHLEILTKQQLATFEASNRLNRVQQIPMQFNAPGPASLFK